MYVGRKYFPPSEKAVIDFIEKYSFATLTGIYNSKPIAVHIPLEIEHINGDMYLVGHVARGNEIKHCFNQPNEMLAVFIEPHAYISSSWYDFVEVPTWNYIAVHASGTVEEMNEEETTKSLYGLVDKYEKGSACPFEMKQLEPKYLKAQVKGIVGFKMKITSLEARFKLSQNRDDKNFYEVVKKLNERGDEMGKVIAEEMQKLRHEK